DGDGNGRSHRPDATRGRTGAHPANFARGRRQPHSGGQDTGNQPPVSSVQAEILRGRGYRSRRPRWRADQLPTRSPVMTHFTRWSTVVSAVLLLWSASVLPARGQGTQSQGTQSKDFIVGAEDVIEVQVWDNKDLNQVVFVRPDGKTSLPLAGEIQA